MDHGLQLVFKWSVKATKRAVCVQDIKITERGGWRGPFHFRDHKERKMPPAGAEHMTRKDSCCVSALFSGNRRWRSLSCLVYWMQRHRLLWLLWGSPSFMGCKVSRRRARPCSKHIASCLLWPFLCWRVIFAPIAYGYGSVDFQGVPLNYSIQCHIVKRAFNSKLFFYCLSGVHKIHP